MSYLTSFSIKLFSSKSLGYTIFALNPISCSSSFLLVEDSFCYVTVIVAMVTVLLLWITMFDALVLLRSFLWLCLNDALTFDSACLTSEEKSR